MNLNEKPSVDDMLEGYGHFNSGSAGLVKAGSEMVGVPFFQDPVEDLEENVADGMTVRQLSEKLEAELRREYLDRGDWVCELTAKGRFLLFCFWLLKKMNLLPDSDRG